jgi:hypothetical protein
MKKRLLVFVAVIIALMATVIPSTAAAACEGDIYIELSDITIDDETPLVGETITISGSATVTASTGVVNPWASFQYAQAFSVVNIVLTDPDSQVAYGDTVSDFDKDRWGYIKAAEATVDYDWSFDYTLDEAGVWSIAQSGYGSYYWHYKAGCWRWVRGADADFKSINKEFFVGQYVPEEYFRFNMPMGYRGARYPDSSTKPGAIENEIDCVGKIDGVQYRFVIPAGTVITNGNGEKAVNFYIKSIDGNTIHSTFSSITFSNPVTVYKAEGVFHLDENYRYVGGEWIEMGSFTEIIDYTGTLN